jgi:hypothetical protein
MIFHSIDGTAEGNIDTDTVSSTVVRTFWRIEDGRRDTSIEGRVSADVIFNTLTSVEDFERIG